MIDRIIRAMGYVPVAEIQARDNRINGNVSYIDRLNKLLARNIDERSAAEKNLRLLKDVAAAELAIRDREIERLSKGQKPRNLKKVAAALHQPRDGRGFARRS